MTAPLAEVVRSLTDEQFDALTYMLTEIHASLAAAEANLVAANVEVAAVRRRAAKARAVLEGVEGALG